MKPLSPTAIYRIGVRFQAYTICSLSVAITSCIKIQIENMLMLMIAECQQWCQYNTTMGMMYSCIPVHLSHTIMCSQICHNFWVLFAFHCCSQMLNIVYYWISVHYPTINQSWFDLIWFACYLLFLLLLLLFSLFVVNTSQL